MRRRRPLPAPEPDPEYSAKQELRKRQESEPMMRRILSLPELDRRLIDEYGFRNYQRMLEKVRGPWEYEAWLVADRAATQEAMLKKRID